MRHSRLVMEQKAEMKKRGIRSPDGADSLCLTFAIPQTQLENRSTNAKTAATILSNQKDMLAAYKDLYGD